MLSWPHHHPQSAPMLEAESRPMKDLESRRLPNLLSKPYANTAQYSPTGEYYFATGDWRVYQYYGTEMTGWRVATEGSTDRLFDVYATSDGFMSRLKILSGPRLALGTWAIEVHGLSHLLSQPSRATHLRTLRFD